MTPAINTLKKAKINYEIHEYNHESSNESYGMEAAKKLGISPKLVFKTLVVSTENNELIVGIVPVDEKLNMKLIAKAVGAKKAIMANTQDVMRTTGYVLGGVSPLGQKKSLRTVIDQSAFEYPIIYVSAGRRGLEIALSAQDLQLLTKATQTNIC
ncbi:Cys-tRNA(Pro) deacylase [Colwelliaceae bacterium 6471]